MLPQANNYLLLQFLYLMIELFQFYHVKNIIRLGSAGAIQKNLRLGDLVLGMSAFSNSSYVTQFGFHGDNAPCADYGLLSRAMENAQKTAVLAVMVSASRVITVPPFSRQSVNH